MAILADLTTSLSESRKAFCKKGITFSDWILLKAAIADLRTDETGS